MNIKLKSVLKTIGIFLIGFIIGAFAIESLEIYGRPTYRQVLLVTIETEQRFLASKANRENRVMEEAFHRWAVINAESDKGFSNLIEEGNTYSFRSYFFPFEMLVLKWITTPQSGQKGRIISESIDRGLLAATLENLGMKDEADRQWAIAVQLQPGKTKEDIMKFVKVYMNTEKTDLHKQAENSVLGN